MKIPKEVRRHCPFCNAHHRHTVQESKRRGRNQTRPLSRGSRHRLRRRGLARGMGNTGRFSRPPVGRRKMMGKKSTKKTDLRYRCKNCKKMHAQKQGIRAKKVEIR